MQINNGPGSSRILLGHCSVSVWSSNLKTVVATQFIGVDADHTAAPRKNMPYVLILKYLNFSLFKVLLGLH
jgi:hypothetical protein